MNNGNDNMKEMFDNLQGQWDTQEPPLGHQERFLDRLNKKQKKKGRSLLYRIALPAAAAIVVLLGIMVTYNPGSSDMQVVAKMSPDTEQTQMYFASIIQKELAKVEKEDSPETKKLVQDALMRMEQLEKDYDKIVKELAARGENKQLIHAMVTNLQTRIAFLEEVLIKIENIKTIKEKYHENNQA